MNRKRLLVLRSLKPLIGRVLAVALLGLTVMGVQGSAATTHWVNDDDPNGGGYAPPGTSCTDPGYSTISAAEAASSSGDTIMVCPGLYAEQVFIDVDNLTFLGAKAGVDARTRAFVPTDESIVDHPCGPVQIVADDVVFDGFTAQGATLNPTIFFSCFGAGIWTNPGAYGNQGGHQLLNNIVQDNIIGISLANTCTNLLRFNLIKDNDNPGAAGGNGIYSDTSLCDTDIDRNKFSGHTSGSILVFGPGANLNITNNELVGGTPERFSIGSTNTGTISGNVSIGSTGVNGTIQLFGGDSNFTINGNTLFNGVRGIRVRDLGAGPNSNVDAHFNCIDGNSIAGMEVDTGGHTGILNAENNWWGSASGPTHPSNPGGNGDAIIDPDGVVDFIPFLRQCLAAPSRVTGGGQVNVMGGGRGSFGFNAKLDNGAASGHLNYQNHVTGAHLNCTVTAITELTTTTAKFSGTCSNPAFPTFMAEVEDNAEPGKNVDKFKITYGANIGEGGPGPIRSGNIQIHK